MAKSSAAEASPQDVLAAVRRREYQPIYLLMGEEGYYTDLICNALMEDVLTEEEKAFNQTVIYCTRETKPAEIVNAARRYPVMAQRQLVVVREMQNLTRVDDLLHYVGTPLQSTVLVLCHKNGSIDKRKSLVSAIRAKGVVVESKRVREGQLPLFIEGYLRAKRVRIEQRAIMMLVANVGADLSRMASELDKLCVTLPAGQDTITPGLVETNIGISKDFNLWEFRTAVIEKDVYKANLILRHFLENGRENPPVVVIATLFNFFAALMQLFYAPNRSERGMMDCLELRSPWQLRDYQTAMRHFTALKTMQIISKLREADGRLKGIGNANASEADIMMELLYFILH